MPVQHGRLAGLAAVVLLSILTLGGMDGTGTWAFGTAACAASGETDGEPDGAPAGVTFAGEHLRLTAYFLDGAVRIVFSDGQERILPQVISASGVRFSDGLTTFWNKGDEAFVEWQGQEYTVRVVDPETDPWEQAKRAGVTLRAVGQEPGWLMEIYENRRVELLLDYGDTRITTRIASMEVDFTRNTTTYRVLPPTSPLAITITAEDQACYDPMSGEGFTVAVVVDFEDTGRLYRGCGRWLN